MPITINTQSYLHKEQYHFARTFAYEGLKPNLKGDLKLDYSEVKHQLKTPTRVHNVIQIRLLLGPYKKENNKSSLSNTVKWKSKETNFPAIYRKFTITQKIKLPDNVPKIKKIISADNDLMIDNVKLYHGRITVKFTITTTLAYVTK